MELWQAPTGVNVLWSSVCQVFFSTKGVKGTRGLARVSQVLKEALPVML